MATLRINLLQTWQGQEVRNVIHYAGGDAVQANALAISDELRNIWVAFLRTNMVTSYSMRGITAKELDVVGNPTIEYPFTLGPFSGTDPVDTLASQMALILRFVSFTARPNRGRIYLAGFGDSAISGGLVTGTFLTDINTVGAALIALPASLGLAMALTITRVDKVTGVLVGSNIVDVAEAVAIPGTQRRRRLGTGI